MSDKSSPSGMKLPDEAKAQDGLNLSPRPRKATRIRKEVRVAFIGVFAVVILGIVFGIFSKRNRQRNVVAKIDPVQSAATVGTNTVDSMQEQAEEAQRQQAGETAQQRGVIPPGDVAEDLNLPPTKIAQESGAGSIGHGQGPTQLTPAQQEALLQQQLLNQAMDAPLIKGGAFGGQQTANGGGVSMPTNLTDILKQGMALRDAFGAGSGSGAGSASGNLGAGSVAGSLDDQNMQANKSAFLNNAGKMQEPPYQMVSRVRALSPYEIEAGWDIPATLEQAINSDLPGQVRGIVRENVFDTATGNYLLIPQGSRVVGYYNSRIAYGQNGIQVVWTRLIYPDGSSIDLGGLNGQDVHGLSGFRYKVNNHYARLVGFALLTSAFSAGIELSQQNTNTGYYLTPQQAATQAVGQQLGELGVEVTRRNLNIQPTIKIPIGYRFNIRVRKDLIFDQPYRVEAALWK